MNVDQLKKEFPILDQKIQGKSLVYLDSGASAQKPRVVIDGMTKFTETSYANVHRGIYHLSQQATYEFEKSRGKISLFINAKNPKEIVFVRSVTEGINLLVHSFAKNRVKSGDEVLVSGMEHHSNLVPWQLLCKEVGATLKIIPVLENGELDMSAFTSMLNSKVKVISVTHVSNVLGTINPIQEICKLAHGFNIPVIVDGAQAVPHLKVDVQKLDCDFYAFTGHKLYGPTGTGAVYGKWNLLNEMIPYQGGGEMVEEVSWTSSTYKEPPARFEAGTPNIVGAIGLGYAIDFVQSIGMEHIQKHEHELYEYAFDQLKKFPEIRILGTAKEKIGLIAFVMDGFHPQDVATILDQEGIAIRVGHHCAQPLHRQFGLQGTMRVCFGIYNTKSDVDRLIAGIEKAKRMLGGPVLGTNASHLVVKPAIKKPHRLG
jgi:cysteine desulfurase/selenocysteine lyase